MKLQINLPFSQDSFKITCVYRITFVDGTFYIGGSGNMRSRASSWKCGMESKNINGIKIGAAVSNKIKQLNHATLDILELCHLNELRDKESFYLDKYKDDPNMVSSNEGGAWKSVLQYTKTGVFVKKHYSTEGAARYIGANIYSVQRVLTGERESCKGMIFIYEHDYHKRRKSIVKSRYKKSERKNGRNVLKINEEGRIVAEFKRIAEAARSVGCSPRNISRVLNGFQKTAGGYSFKYPEKIIQNNLEL